MSKKSSASYQRGKPVKKSKPFISVIENKSEDDRIDFTDIAELDFDKLGKPLIGKFYRPVKKPISIRMDADVLDWFKEHAHYQKLINKACRLYMRQHQRK